MNLSPFYVLPIAFVFVSYLQHVHDKANSGLALGIVKDPQVSAVHSLREWDVLISSCPLRYPLIDPVVRVISRIEETDRRVTLM